MEIKRANTMFTYTLKYILANNVLIDLSLWNFFIYGNSRKGESKRQKTIFINDQSIWCYSRMKERHYR